MTQKGDIRSFTAGHFELQIDGHPSTAYLKTVDGGYVRAALMDEPIGPENHRIKHTSVVEIEPFSVDFGISGADHVLKWIQQSWRKSFSRRNGQISHANFDLYQTFQHEFYDALITETTFPALDGASKEAAYIKIKVQPERVVTKKTGGGRVQSNLGPKQKLWMCSGFRLKIDGLPDIEYTNKIESFTIKQGVRKFYTGEDRFPQIEPTKIEFPSISGTISLGYADGLIKWYDHYVVKGQADPKAQKSGSLEFLAPDRAQTLFRINLYEVGLHHLAMVQSQANADQIKRMKFELYVGRMDLDGGGALGMEG
jgi:tail tube protein gp19